MSRIQTELPSSAVRQHSGELARRFFFVFFFIQILPIDAAFWQRLFSTNWLSPGYDDLFYLSRYQPQFLPGGASWANWVVVAVLAVTGTAVWYFRKPEWKTYEIDRHRLRTALRYRLALGILAYGLLKFFPLQAPPPSISHLNTAYGDFSAWKIFALSLGIVPGYQSFLGLVETTAGLLLLHRKTTTPATLIILPFTGNVFFSNLAYEGGEYLYSAYLLVIALYLFAYDAERLYRLFSLGEAVQAVPSAPVWTAGRQRTVRLVLKSAFVLFFVVFYGFKIYDVRHEGYHYPRKAGLAGLEGLYDVAEFKINRKTIPYSNSDTLRWQNVVFERWNTISISTNQPVITTAAPTEEIYRLDSDRDFEWTGTQGRHYYQYEADTVGHKLVLTNRNPHHYGQTWDLKYRVLNDSTITLDGVNQTRDSVQVRLHRLDRKYLIYEVQKSGRRGRLVL